MNQLKNGKKSIENKKKSADLTPLSHDDIYANPLKLPKEIEEELERKNLVPRFINAKDLYRNQGYHKAGWQPFRSECAIINKSTRDFHQGADPEGIIRRGDCILAVKTKEDVGRHRAYLAEKASRYKNFNKQKAEELRDIAKEHGGAIIIEGYDEN